MWALVTTAGLPLGPIIGGLLLDHFWWGSVFLLTLPLAVIALGMAIWLVPAHVNESTETVDKDEPPKIQEEADKAAAQVQPRWKSVVKWVLIIAIVLVVAIVIGPMVIACVT